MEGVRSRVAVGSLVLAAALASCGSSSMPERGTPEVTTTTCAALPVQGPDSVPSQEQIKQLGENGGGCVRAYAATP